MTQGGGIFARRAPGSLGNRSAIGILSTHSSEGGSAIAGGKSQALEYSRVLKEAQVKSSPVIAREGGQSRAAVASSATGPRAAECPEQVALDHLAKPVDDEFFFCWLRPKVTVDGKQL
jgi:hypothetical protein